MSQGRESRPRAPGAIAGRLRLCSWLLIVGVGSPSLWGAPGEGPATDGPTSDPACITLIVDGMMKSRSGAT